MAESTPTQEELGLRRRARRRLVGAVALALLAVVVLPMVFDPEPRPLGDKVDIRIPDQDAPFEPAPANQAAPVPGPVVTEDAPLPENEPAPAKETPVAAPETSAPPVAKPPPAVKPAVKPVAKPQESKPASPAKVAEVKATTPAAPAQVPAPVAGKASAAKPASPGGQAAGEAYYLQLGVFSSLANAGQMIDRAKAAGFKAAAVPVGGQFKVRIGPIADRNKALDYQAKLKARSLDNVLVEP